MAKKAKKMEVIKGNWMWYLFGLALIILGAGLYIGSISLEATVALVLVLWGLKKIYMASRYC